MNETRVLELSDNLSYNERTEALKRFFQRLYGIAVIRMSDKEYLIHQFEMQKPVEKHLFSIFDGDNLIADHVELDSLNMILSGWDNERDEDQAVQSFGVDIDYVIDHLLECP